ncbi:MAG: DUF721 domain-containing protein [Pedosphaera sp.]|nr:DUF721 domain-containing protein [Pedosphaera sp.]
MAVRKSKKIAAVPIALLPPDPYRQRRNEAVARARAVDQWRRMPYTAAAKAWETSTKSISTVLTGVLGKMRLDQRLDESRILQIWPQIIDPQIVAHASPAGFAKGTLFVTVDSNVWLDEIVRYRRKEILERLQTSLGKTVVQKISFRLG